MFNAPPLFCTSAQAAFAVGASIYSPENGLVQTYELHH